MALKFSYTASETLNDIILHRLQDEGLQKAESLEKSFYDKFERMTISPQAQQVATTTPLPAHAQLAMLNNEFSIVYTAQADDIIVLDICHVSRYANVLNN